MSNDTTRYYGLVYNSFVALQKNGAAPLPRPGNDHPKAQEAYDRAMIAAVEDCVLAANAKKAPNILAAYEKYFPHIGPNGQAIRPTNESRGNDYPEAVAAAVAVNEVVNAYRQGKPAKSPSVDVAGHGHDKTEAIVKKLTYMIGSTRELQAIEPHFAMAARGKNGAPLLAPAKPTQTYDQQDIERSVGMLLQTVTIASSSVSVEAKEAIGKGEKADIEKKMQDVLNKIGKHVGINAQAEKDLSAALGKLAASGVKDNDSVLKDEISALRKFLPDTMVAAKAKPQGR